MISRVRTVAFGLPVREGCTVSYRLIEHRHRHRSDSPDTAEEDDGDDWGPKEVVPAAAVISLTGES